MNTGILDGVFNIWGAEAHVLADTPWLKPGLQTLGGDPTYYNTGGNVSVPLFAAAVGSSIAMVASRDILPFVAIGLSELNTSGGVNGGEINLSAGAQFVPTGPGGSCGQELVLAPNSRSVKQAIMDNVIGRRRIRTFDLSDTRHVAVAEVSLISLVGNSKTLAQLAHSADSDDRRVLDKLVKMAACLTVVTGKHGPYSQTPKF